MCCDLALMLFVSDGGDWNLVNKAWHGDSLPEGQVVEKSGSFYFVARKCRRGALTWTVHKRVGERHLLRPHCQQTRVAVRVRLDCVAGVLV